MRIFHHWLDLPKEDGYATVGTDQYAWRSSTKQITFAHEDGGEENWHIQREAKGHLETMAAVRHIVSSIGN